METIFWHDYETFGADPLRDRPCQFAGIRTDLDLNIIEEPVVLFCQPTEDFLPSPDACLVTGITPQQALKEGVSEVEFAQLIHQEFMRPGTCVAGYNSIRFDDEVSRNLFYRNFYDPYEREWKNGNSRWDLIDVVRLTYALRPEGISWPVDDDGLPSFRLEKLTAANGIEHANAHDAMSDVYATIAMAKIIRDRQPQLFEFVFSHRRKDALQALIDMNQHKPLFHVSSKYHRQIGSCAVVAPICPDPNNNNGVVAFDLRQDPQSLMQLSADEIHERMYTKQEALPPGCERPALKVIHVNKCPMIAPASMLKSMSVERRQDWALDINIIQSHLEWLRAHPEFRSHVHSVFSKPREFSDGRDPDLMIYTGGFFSGSDKQEMARVRETPADLLAEEEFRFQDARLPEMLFRYKARNFPATLNEEEQERWALFCSARIMKGEEGFLSASQYMARIEQLQDEVPEQASLLEDLKFYLESIIPYY